MVETIMSLEKIGFYTLHDERVKHASTKSPLYRGEIIITSVCNFKCPYCRGVDFKGHLPLEKIKNIIDLWNETGLKNIRFSGGEPTLHPNILDCVLYTKQVAKGIEHIAISTNGSNTQEMYQKLIDAGVNDFSISLDACCAEMGDKMSGGVKGSWERVIENIRFVSKQVYTTVGIVLTNENIGDLNKTIMFAHSLGVADIRIISAAQFNKQLPVDIPYYVLNSHPILKYRIENIKKNINVRGISDTDNNKCPLVLDDSAIMGDSHYPCIIYMRERGAPIGKISNQMRQERLSWCKNHNTHMDEICRKNCLDVCKFYNNKFKEIHNNDFY